MEYVNLSPNSVLVLSCATTITASLLQCGHPVDEDRYARAASLLIHGVDEKPLTIGGHRIVNARLAGDLVARMGLKGN